MSEDWIADCTTTYGYVLDGPFSHWCGDWDDLPIDATCMEFLACTCFDHEDTKEHKKKLEDELVKDSTS